MKVPSKFKSTSVDFETAVIGTVFPKSSLMGSMKDACICIDLLCQLQTVLELNHWGFYCCICFHCCEPPSSHSQAVENMERNIIKGTMQTVSICISSILSPQHSDVYKILCDVFKCEVLYPALRDILQQGLMYFMKPYSLDIHKMEMKPHS